MVLQLTRTIIWNQINYFKWADNLKKLGIKGKTDLYLQKKKFYYDLIKIAELMHFESSQKNLISFVHFFVSK